MDYLPSKFKKGLLFVVYSSVISGCSSFNLYESDQPTTDTNVETTQATDNKNTNKSAAANSTTLVASNKEIQTANTKPHEKSQAEINESLRDAFKGPKALQDIQALSVELNQGRGNQRTASAASVFMKEKPQSNTQVALINDAPSPVVAAKVAPSEVAAVVTVSNKRVEPGNRALEISSVEDVNRLIEENPTAAGIKTTDVLDVPKVTEPVTLSNMSTSVKKPSASKVSSAFTTSNFGIWTVEKNWDGKHPGVCRISTPTMQIDQHDFTSQLWFSVIDGKLLVNSTTNIDIKQPGVGIKANNGTLKRFAEKVHASNAVWSGNLKKTLKSSDELKIILGGQELGKNTHETSIDLKDLKKGFPEYQKCNG